MRLRLASGEASAAGGLEAEPKRRPLTGSRFALVWNGFAEGAGPALRDYLVAKRAGAVTCIAHPLLPEEGNAHVITHWQAGVERRSTSIKLPSHPPQTYALDLMVPPVPPPVDVWFAFNATACLRGLAARRIGRAACVVYWCVDYVEQRFGRGLLTRSYEWLEGVACRRADARFELSAAMAGARDQRHRGRALVPARIVPMGAWTARTPKARADAWQQRRLAYLGHLVPRQGVTTMLSAIAILRRRGFVVSAEVVGRGSEESELRGQVRREGIDDLVHFHGYVDDHRKVEAILAECSIGVAPYVAGIGSFTEFADPGKIKAYLGAGLPIVLTAVPPIAPEIAASGAGVVVESSPEAVANGVQVLLRSPEDWRRRHEAAMGMAQRYDWEVIFTEALQALGFQP